VKILLDECVDWRLSRDIADHDVKSARQMGWSAIKNGELLTLAAQHEFDVFVTTDRNLSFQQNIRELPMAVIVLQAKTNRLQDLKPLVPELLDAARSARPGTVITVGKP
jgi:predicted nuclease of predicted toxin-antitoxin system